MCYGAFPSGGYCSSCKIVRSCKRETLNRLKNERRRNALISLQSIKYNSIEKFSIENTKRILYELLSRYMGGASTYRLTKDFKRYYNVNVSDTRIRDICFDMCRDGSIDFLCKGNSRVWFVKRS